MNLPIALTIAGSDSSAGAGAQADLKTMSALGVYALTAISAVVAEVPGRVAAIQPISPEIVREQIRILLAAFPVAAVKTGMLYSREIIEVVAEELGKKCAARKLPLVVDPVMIATSGDTLTTNDAVLAYVERLFPLATLITPNLDEAAALLGEPIRDLDEMRAAGSRLAAQFGTAILLKGGHLRGESAVDLLFANGEVHEFSAPFFRDISTHGTGCTYSAAITAGLAYGLALEMAVSDAKAFVTAAIAQHLRWENTNGSGNSTEKIDALHHFARL